MAEEKRWESMTELMYQDTKDFAVQFIEEQTPVFKEYQLGLYKQLLQCYDRHITGTAVATLDSNAMLDYYSCYKRILIGSREQNRKLYELGFDIEKKFKTCLEVKSNYCKTTFEFRKHHHDCIDSYKQRYYQLYDHVFKGTQLQKEGPPPEQPQTSST